MVAHIVEACYLQLNSRTIKHTPGGLLRPSQPFLYVSLLFFLFLIFFCHYSLFLSVFFFHNFLSYLPNIFGK